MSKPPDNKKLHPHQLPDSRWIHNDLRDSGNIRARRARRRLTKFARLIIEMFRPETGQLEARSLLITFLDHPNANIWDEGTRRALRQELLELYGMLSKGRTGPTPTIEFALEGGDSRSGLCHAHGLGSSALDEFVGPEWCNRTVTLPSGQRLQIHRVRIVPADRIWNTWVYMHKTPDSEAIRKPWQTDAEYDHARACAVTRHQSAKANLTAAGISRRSSSQVTLGPASSPEEVSQLTRKQTEGLILLCRGALKLSGEHPTTFKGLLRSITRAVRTAQTERRRARRAHVNSVRRGPHPLMLLALVLLALALVRDVPGPSDLTLRIAATARAAVHGHQHQPRHAVGPP